MRIFGYNIELKKVNDRERLGDILFPQWNIGREIVQPENLDSLINAYKSWVYICGNLNSRSIAQIPLKLYITKPENVKILWESVGIIKEQKDYLFSKPNILKYIKKDMNIEEITEHPFLDLMRNVNKFMNRFDLWEKTQLHLELSGNAYWYILKNNLNVPEEIWILPPHKMQIVPDRKEFIKGYVFNKGIDKIPFNETEIIHFKFPHPNNDYYGMSPLSGIAQDYNINENMMRYENATFSNMAQPNTILSMENELTDEQFDRITEQWNQKYKGASKAGKFAMLNGIKNVYQLQMSPRELNFLSGRKFTRQIILGAYGIPESMVTTEAVNLANAKIGEYQYMKNTIRPRLCRIEEKINEKLMPMFDERLFVAFDNPVPEDKEFELTKRVQHVNAGITSRNEERIKLGIKPGDEGLDTIYLPMGLMPIGTVEEKEIEIISDKIAENIILKLNKKKPKYDKDEYWNNYIKLINPYEKNFITKLRELFNKQEKEVLANMKNNPKAKIDDIDLWIFGRKTWERRFSENGNNIIKGIIVANGRRILDDLPVTGISFDVENERIVEILKNRTIKFSRDVVGTTETEIREALTEGISAGEGMPELRKRVQSVFENASRIRANVIARTETIWGSNMGAEEAYIQSGVVESKEWLLALDERTCDFCIEMDERFGEGKGIEPGKTFFDKGDTMTVGDNTIEFDYDDIVNPPIHPNCRCTIIPVIRE